MKAVDDETFQLLRASIRRFVAGRLVPAEDAVEQSDDIPQDLVDEMKGLGLFGLSIPEEYGGIGLTMAQESELIFDISHTTPAFRSLFSTNIGIGSQGILLDGTDEQKRAWLPKFASGEQIISFALTEPDSGSDAASLSTRARKDGDHYVLNGTKRFITNANRASVFTLMARTGGPGAGGVSAFILPADTPGITVGHHDAKMGQRGTRTADVILEDVAVPAENVIGAQEGRGFYTAMKVLDRGRIHVSAVACGAADRLIRDGARYAQERKQFGQRIGDFQLVQAMLADSWTELQAGLALLRTVAARYDDEWTGARNPSLTAAAAATKMYCTEMVCRVADRIVQVFGGAGYISEYKVERFYRDVRLYRLYEGTTQIQQIVIGRHLMKQDYSGLYD